MSTNNESDSGKAFLLGILVGGAIGALAGLLLAPRKGDEIRSLIAEKSTDYAEIAKTKATEFAETVQQNVGQAKAKSTEVFDKATEGVETVKDKAVNLANEATEQLKSVASTVRDAISSAQEASKNTKSKLQSEFGDNHVEPGA